MQGTSPVEAGVGVGTKVRRRQDRACFYNDCMKYLGYNNVGVYRRRSRDDCIKWGVVLAWKGGKS